MGQKTHTSGVRLGYVQEWENKWYTLKKREGSVLLFQTFLLRSLLSYYFFKRNLFFHSFSFTYLNNSLYLFLNVVPKFTNIFNHFKFITSKNFKRRLKEIKLRCVRTNGKELSDTFLKFSKRRFIKSFNPKRFNKSNPNFSNFSQIRKGFQSQSLKKLSTNLINFSKFFVFKKVFLKTFLKFEVSFTNFKSLVKAIGKFNNFSSIILKFRNLSKSYYYSKDLFFDLKMNRNYQSWYYYFLIMRKFGISSSLLCYCLKDLIETPSLRKKQLFFLRNLKGFLVSYFVTELFSLIKGIKILVTGRINGRSRGSFYKIQIGSLPFSTFSQKISYTFIPAFNVYGSYGIKVWISYV